MRAILCCSLATVALSSCRPADDPKEEKTVAGQLVGRWKQHEEKGKYPRVIEFRDDGMMRAILTINGEDYNLVGKYRTDGNKLVIVLRDDIEHDEVYIVNKLTDTELVWTTPEEQERETFTRLKDK